MRFCFDKKDFVDVDTDSTKLAVIGDDFQLSWSEFEQKVNDLVAVFTQYGLEQLENPVMVYGHKSTNMLVAFYAMMKLEIAYIPVDMIYPKDRIQKIIDTTACQVILNATSASLDFENVTEIKLSQKSILVQSNTEDYRKRKPNKDPTIYIIFTSGSTGEPKGVQITTEAVQSFGRWMSSDEFGFTSNDCFINTALLSFDLSVFEVMTFGYLGGTIMLNSKEQCADPKQLMARISQFKSNIWVSTPSFALTYSRIEDTSLLSSIHTFLFCGEVLPHPLAKKLKVSYPKAKVINTYGPTEATVATTIVEITDEILEKYDTLPVGKSKMESQLIIEDKEIIIAGPNVSIGYVKNEKLNAEKFFVLNGQRAFRTGDNGYIENDMLFFFGRNDDLVKLHGYRIELNEITGALNNIGEVVQGETIALKRNGDVKKIVSLVQLSVNSKLDAKGMLSILAETLPNYMLPSDIKIIDQIPLNQNGKSDKKLLELAYLKKL